MREKPISPTRYFPMVLAILLFVAGCATARHGQEPLRESKDAQGIVEADGRVMDKPHFSEVKNVDGELDAEKDFITFDGKKSSSVSVKPQTHKRMIGVKPFSTALTGQESSPNTKSDPEPPIRVEFAFDNADLYEVLDATMYELYKVNYMVDPSIKAKLTFNISGEYTKSEFINIFNNVLQLNNLAIVQGPPGIFKVVRRTESASAGNFPLSTAVESVQAGDMMRMFRLNYINSALAASNLRHFLSKGASVVQNPATNALFITDTPENLEKAARILSVMDVEYFSNISWRIFPVNAVDANDIARDLTKVLNSVGLYNRPGIDKGNFEILPIKTMNALLVVTRWPSLLELIQDWVFAMDHADESESDVFVYFVENGTAADLAEILIKLYGGTVEGGPKKTVIVQPDKGQPEAPVSGALGGKVEIIPNETNNAIVFKASRRDYQTIQKVLAQLDIVPRQVLINTVIVEVTLQGALQYGVEWFLHGYLNNEYTVVGALDNQISRAIDTGLGAASGFSFAVFDAMDFLRGLVQVLGDDAEINLLNSPNLLVVDNKEAIIEAGDEIPTVTGQVTDAASGTTVTNTIQYRKTGVILKVTPHISSTGLVKLDISQEVSEPGELNLGLNTRSILTRKAETSLVVQDGQTLIIGGLIRTKKDVSSTGIPYLKDMPMLGFLFGSKSQEIRKTELIMVITPHVIKNRKDADAVTAEFLRQVDRMKETIEQKEF